MYVCVCMWISAVLVDFFVDSCCVCTWNYLWHLPLHPTRTFCTRIELCCSLACMAYEYILYIVYWTKDKEQMSISRRLLPLVASHHTQQINISKIWNPPTCVLDAVCNVMVSWTKINKRLDSTCQSPTSKQSKKSVKLMRATHLLVSLRATTEYLIQWNANRLFST